mmetsp:Transcript_18683/g.29304  ORF Transcript_18683/g.29304 Transcript_18683/m.29304 type:complete len:330 (-) Transcript_18683:558-1547(-)
MSQIDVCLIAPHRVLVISRFPHTAFHSTHGSLTCPYIGELPNSLHLQLDTTKNWRWNSKFMLMTHILRWWWKRHTIELNCISRISICLLPTNSLFEFFQVDVTVSVFVKFHHKMAEEHCVQLQSEPIQSSLELTSAQHSVTILIKCCKRITSIHTTRLEKSCDPTHCNAVLQHVVLILYGEDLLQRRCIRISLLSSTVGPDFHEEFGSFIGLLLLQSSEQNINLLRCKVDSTIDEAIARLSCSVLVRLCILEAYCRVKHCSLRTQSDNCISPRKERSLVLSVDGKPHALSLCQRQCNVVPSCLNFGLDLSAQHLLQLVERYSSIRIKIR